MSFWSEIEGFFDPGGDPKAILAAANACTELANALDGVDTRLDPVARKMENTWKGTGSAAFQKKWGTFSTSVSEYASHLRSAAKELESIAATIESAQEQATTLKEMAVAALITGGVLSAVTFFASDALAEAQAAADAAAAASVLGRLAGALAYTWSIIGSITGALVEVAAKFVLGFAFSLLSEMVDVAGHLKNPLNPANYTAADITNDILGGMLYASGGTLINTLGEADANDLRPLQRFFDEKPMLANAAFGAAGGFLGSTISQLAIEGKPLDGSTVVAIAESTAFSAGSGGLMGKLFGGKPTDPGTPGGAPDTVAVNLNVPDVGTPAPDIPTPAAPDGTLGPDPGTTQTAGTVAPPAPGAVPDPAVAGQVPPVAAAGVAPDPAVAGQVPPVAAAGVAPDPAVAGQVPPVAAAGVAPDPAVAGQVPPVAAAGVAPDPAVAGQVPPVAAAGVAPDPAVAGQVPPVAAAGVAPDPAVAAGVAPDPAVAAGVAPDPAVAAGVAPDPAVAAGVAPDPAVAAGVAPDPAVAAGVAPDPAVAAGVAPDPAVAAGVAPDPAVAAGVAPDPAVAAGVAPDPAVAAGVAPDPAVAAGVAPDPAVAAGVAPDPAVAAGVAPAPDGGAGTPASPGRIARILNGVSNTTGIKKPDLVRGSIGVLPGVVSFVINYGGQNDMGLPGTLPALTPPPPVPVMHVPSPPAPPPLPPHVGGGTFTVQPGDNLYNIAKERFGNPNLYPLLQAANPQVGPNGLIFPGQVLHIPEIRTPPANSVAQVVQPGDSLWDFANGNEALVQQIAELNHIKDPALIFPGQVLIIPPAA